MSERPTFIKGDELVLFRPFRLVRIDLGPTSTLHLHDLQCLSKRLDVFGQTKDEFVISSIDSAADELATFRVCSRNDEILAAHHIPLETCCVEAIDVLADWYEHFAS